MLSEIRISSLGAIKAASAEFDRGLTVLTGETGAGKTMVVTGLHLLGERLHLLHLIGMLLIVAVGSNYALFFDRTERHHQLDPETLASMLIANLTTAIGFGTLALSEVPILQAVGMTVGPGAILALLFSAIFVPRETAA